MPINPITVAKFEVGGLMGHSNADGWGTTDGLFQITSPSIFKPAGDWDTDPTRAYWKNIYVFTSAQPFPTKTSGQTNQAVASSESTGEWLEMTIANAMSPADAHPHSSPYNYANVAGACYPRWMYEAWPWNGAYTQASGGTPTGIWFNDDPRTPCNGVRHGIEIPLMKLRQAATGKQIGLVKVAFSSSVLNAAEQGYAAHADWLDGFNFGKNYTPTHPAYVRSAMDHTKTIFYAHWTPRNRFDFSAATERLYAMWANKMNAAKAALPDGVEMDLSWVVTWIGDNDSNTMPEDELRATFENNVRALINRIRSDAVTNKWTQRPAEQIKIIWPRVYVAYNSMGTASWNAPTFCNEVLERIAADDEYMEVIDNLLWKTLSNDVTTYGTSYPIGIEPSTHFGSSGYVTGAKAVSDAIDAIDANTIDALPVEGAITVADARIRVQRYYARSRGTVDIDENELLQHLNAAQMHCFNQSGDNLWWCERRDQMSVTGGSSIHTFPRYVHRVLFIEDPNDPQYPLRFEMIGHTDKGKLQVQLRDATSGTYYVRYVTVPRRLTAEQQLIQAPENVIEWIIVETCRRLAASAANAPLASYFAGESMQLQQDAMRFMGQKKRMKRLRMRTQRRRPLLGYKNNWSNQTGRDNGQ